MIGQSLQIRNCNLKNRIVLPPMFRGLATEEGKMTEDLVDYYVKRSEFLGLLTVEFSFVLDHGKGIWKKKMIGMLKENIPLFKDLVTKVHEKKTSIIIQIAHCGVQSDDPNPVGPSNIDFTGKKREVIELTKERIQEIYNEFIDAALVAKESGFDGIEVHCAHGYLLNQFYSPISNHRTDEYGGSVENRIKLTCDIVKGIRKAVGDNFMISVRIGAVDYDMDGGNKIDDAVTAAKLIEEAGADMISVTGGLSGFLRKNCKIEGYFKDASTAIKAAVHVPVLLTGGILTKEAAEKLLEEKACDLIGVGRPMLVNFNFVKDLL